MRDNSTKKQWRDRCSMDFVLRIYASLLSTLTMTLIAVSLNGEDFHIFYGHGTEHHAVLGFMLIASACEFVHILCVYLCAKDDLFSPFVNWVSSMTLAHQFIQITVFATVLVVLLS